MSYVSVRGSNYFRFFVLIVNFFKSEFLNERQSLIEDFRGPSYEDFLEPFCTIFEQTFHDFCCQKMQEYLRGRSIMTSWGGGVSEEI